MTASVQTKPEPFRDDRYRWISSTVPEQISWDTQCIKCLDPMPQGTWARASGGGGWVHDKCPKFAARCGTCFMEHAGECL